MQKIKATGVRGIQSHDLREKPPRTNPDIQWGKTADNYSLKPCENFAHAVRARIEDSVDKKQTVKKDAVLMCQFLVTSDHSFFSDKTVEQQREFFQQSLDFLAGRYGKENLISATVHMDEKTPHMHVNMTPVKGSKLSAKAIFDRKELIALQTDFHTSVGQSWGLDRGQNLENKRRHLDTEEFKIKTRTENLKSLHELEAAYESLRAQGVWLTDKDIARRGNLLNKETVADVAERLNGSHIRPMAMKTNKALEEAKVSQEKHEKAFAELAALKRDFTDGLEPQQVERVKAVIVQQREANLKSYAERAEKAAQEKAQAVLASEKAKQEKAKEPTVKKAKQDKDFSR
jgi:hypothetical protein